MINDAKKSETNDLLGMLVENYIGDNSSGL